MTDFDELYASYYEFIFKFLWKYCKNDDLAEELTQETFFRAYMNIKSLRDPAKLPTWLCQIAKNTFFAWYRAQKKQNLIAASEWETLFDSPEEECMMRELTVQAMAHLQTLEQPYRAVLMLSVFGEISFSDISRLYGKSESWARVTFYRAKQKIAEKMRDENEL